ncbi:MAG TPA: ATP synthase F1 subunit gamma [Candidatus Scybalocola faecigallinarum]|uniref:ATP synthase gamma chain n=1 Tax=Candidatus Scybalocola faecigallinarum TaxID=2840941 RepID=A0A9D1F5Q6_9FIRM|nr:ATP synthase F1 subunit gamma [Candidatus Scybalocola faecigallinarum]
MASTKEIQDRIRSIEDTMKITSAMYMISSSKMKNAKKKLAEVSPYFYRIRGEITRILRHVPDVKHPLFDLRPDIPRDQRKIGIIVVTGDKGLAGAYNHNVLKLAEEMMAAPGQYKLFLLGMVGKMYFAKKDVDVDSDPDFLFTVQKPTLHQARVIAERILADFEQGLLDEVHIIYSELENAVTVEAKTEQLLPLKKAAFDTSKIPADLYHEEIVMNPSPREVLSYIIPNYITGVLFGTLVESYASENNARMMAMESSTNNAKDMLKDLEIVFNRARQAAITQEITEVIGGAKAQKRK